MSELIKLTDCLWVRRSEHWENYYLWCEGCKELHDFRTKAPHHPDSTIGQSPLWQFNGNTDRPTFTPSLLYLRYLADYRGCKPRCHIIVTDGRIQFCSDCEHELAGKTVEMVSIADKIPSDYMIA